jgi:hypothetical protein
VSAPLRVAGWGALDDGAAITWTIAQGRRGRRWREVVARGEAVGHSLLLETDAVGRFSHLELARAGGLWTFHPEPDGTLHGNHVDPRERDVHHVVGMRFAPDDLLVIEGSPLAAAAIAWRLSTEVGEGSSATFAGVVLHATGAIEALRMIGVERLSGTRWRIGDGRPFDIGADGVPSLTDGETRPLELA